MSVVRTIADQFAEVSKERGLLRERGHRIRSEFASTINLVSVPAVRTESPDDKTALNEFVELRHAHVVLAMPDRDKLVDAAEYLCSCSQSIQTASNEDLSDHFSGYFAARNRALLATGAARQRACNKRGASRWLLRHSRGQDNYGVDMGRQLRSLRGLGQRAGNGESEAGARL